MRGTSSLRFVFVAATCIALASHAHLAEAQPRGEKAATDQRARELFQKGDAAYAEGRYEEALASFQEAYELSGRPQLLFNISNALERLGRYAEAVEALEKYLASGKARDRDVVQKRLASVKKRAEEQKKEEERKAKEEEERRQREAEERRRAEAARDSGARATPPDQPPPPAKSTAVLPIALMATGGALFVTGGVFGILTLSARSDASAGCTDSPAGRLCSSDAHDALSREKTFGIIADVGMLSGLVLGGVGTYLFVTRDKGESPVRVNAGRAAVRVSGKPGGAEVEVVGAF
jgi:tetratricopeptide (TPR) repeat protein